MNQLHIDGDLTDYTRRAAGRIDYGRLVRTFLTAMFVGVVVAGIYFAIMPVSVG